MLIRLKNKRANFAAQIPGQLSATYFPFFDGLRGFAIISVILSHVLRDTPWVSIGVHLFFILSGFLITTLLLKEKTINGNVSLKNFYMRRMLRIFPVAYLFVLVLIVLNRLFNLQITTQSFLSTVFYLKNFPLLNDWYTGHFWTLSVEEQFYLLMPALLVFNTRAYMLVVFTLFVSVPIVGYLAYNNVGIFYTSKTVHIAAYIFLAVFDNGALYILAGSLLSILIFKGVINMERLKGKYYYLTFALFICALVVHFPFADGNFAAPYFCPIIFTLLIMLIISIDVGRRSLLTRILSNPVLVKIGVLSYSLYVWQQLFTFYQPWRWIISCGGSPYFNIPLLFVTAYLSYTFYESPFLKLKKRFAYRKANCEVLPTG